MKKVFYLIIIILLFRTFSIFSQDRDIDLNSFVNELQKQSPDDGEITLVWWIPVEYWDVSLRTDESISDNEVREITDALSPYTIFAVVDGVIGPFGGVEYVPKDSIQNTIQLIDEDGTVYWPLESNLVSPDVQNLLSLFKPIIKNMIGPLGENMHFFVFNDKDGNKRIFDPYQVGFVKVNFCDSEYTYRTPIGSLLPQKICPVDQEKMNGAWKYCPWHGEELIERNFNQ